jgi:hypothetical protein
MSKFFILFFILFTQISLSNPSFSISQAEERISQLDDRTYRQSPPKDYEERPFRPDDHRYDRRYRYFNYDKYGYYNIDGLYYGYFDRKGYFFNNIYFKYNSKYKYIDRLHKRGYFSPYRHHYRRYIYHEDNDWNRVHQYREPNRIVYGYYYQEEYFPRDRRVNYHHNYNYNRDRIDIYREREPISHSIPPVIHREDNYYNRYHRERNYHRHRHNYRDHHHTNHRYREERYRPKKNNAKVIYYRFKDKKEKK